jgi:PHD/YefM family antitoxin component YafN of YafNO toxin-antitoxin module
MIDSTNLRTITDMRKKADELLAMARKSKEPIGILRNNKLEAYLIDAKTLENLEKVVEDYLDTRAVKQVDLRKAKDFEDLEKIWDEEDLTK